MDDLLSLDGPIGGVSGAGGGGIGTTLTRMAAEAGATVVAVSRSKENLDEHIAPMAKNGLSVVQVSADASTDEGVAAVLDQVRRTEGNLYGLVNIAGGAAPATWMPSTRVSRSDWRELFVANLETAFFMSQAISRELRRLRLKGSIISLSSISGMNTAPFHIAYGTAKAAVVAMTRTMAVELALGNIPVKAVAPGVIYTAEEYGRAERDKLWRKVWQQVGRVEEIPEVGGYLTYHILDDSIIVVRTGPGNSCSDFAAHHNVCMHRGRRLVDTPDGAKNACGRARKSFVCGFHGWTYGLDGACTHIREQDDWKGVLTPQNTQLAPVQVDTWGGWLFINMDPDCEPLADYLFPAAKILDPFGLENMRYKWRKWLNFDCNWKVAMEAFNETYHVFITHPEFNKFGEFKGWAKAQGKHSNIGYDAPKDLEATKSKISLSTDADPRIRPDKR